MEDLELTGKRLYDYWWNFGFGILAADAFARTGIRNLEDLRRMSREQIKSKLSRSLAREVFRRLDRYGSESVIFSTHSWEIRGLSQKLAGALVAGGIPNDTVLRRMGPEELSRAIPSKLTVRALLKYIDQSKPTEKEVDNFLGEGI